MAALENITVIRISALCLQPGLVEMKVAILGDHLDVMFQWAEQLGIKMVDCRPYTVIDLSIDCRFEGEYSDNHYSLVGMPVKWQSESFADSQDTDLATEQMDVLKPAELSGFFAQFHSRPLRWANITHGSDTAISLGWVRFGERAAAATKSN